MVWKQDGGGQLVRSALGRNAFIGELYNVRNESLSSRSLFKASLPSHYVQKRKTSSTELEYKFTENLSDRFEFLNVEGELQVSVLCGLVKVEGSGKYLTEDKKSNKGVSCSFICKFHTVCEKIFTSFDEIIQHVDLTALSDPAYTHVIAEINWGANCLVTLEAMCDCESDKKLIKGNLSAEMEKLSKLVSLQGNAKVSGEKNSKSANNTVCFKVCADIVPDKGVPTSIETFQGFVREIPDLLRRTNDGKGIPLNYVLIPLQTIRKAGRLEIVGDVIVKTIDESFLISMSYLFDEIALVKRSLNDLLQELTEWNKFVTDEDIKRTKKQIETLKLKESELKLIISEEWPLVRSGVKQLKELVRRIEKFKGHDLCLFAHEEFLECFEAVRSKMVTMRNFLSSGVICVGKGQKFGDVLSEHPDSELVVMVSSSEFENNDATLNQSTNHYFVTLVADAEKNTKYVYVDLEFVSDVSRTPGKEKENIFFGITLTEPRIFHLVRGRLASSNLFGDFLVERESNFARLKNGSEIQPMTHKPGNRVTVELTCPGFQTGSCSSEKRVWICFRCKNKMEYAFDEHFYCSCGRGSVSGYHYRCSDLKHGPSFVSPQDKFLKEELSILRPLKELNILILGQSGVGKSTWINSIVNYLSYETLQSAKEEGVLCQIPLSFTSYNPKTMKKTIVRIGTENQEEETTAGSSATQCCHTYNFILEDRYVRLIDTPGLGDTRGISQDQRNMRNIVDHIGNLRELHGVCVLMKANDNRINALFAYCIKELLVHLHKSIARNIIFCFTNARNSFYTPGQTSALLEKLMENLGVAEILALGQHNMFCLDNEAFLFLCTWNHPEIHYEDHLTTSFEESWKISLRETKRLFETIKSFKPHCLNETLSLVTARSRILSLTKPIAEISRTIQLNLDAINRKKKEISVSNQNLAELAKKLKINEIHLEPEPLNHPRTVCTSSKCVEYHKYGSLEVTEIEYKTHCHVQCFLTNVEPKTVNNYQLQECSVMTKGTCRVCGCSWRSHMHLTISQKRVERETTDEKIESFMEKEKSDREKIEKFVRDLETKTEKYKQEQDQILQTSVKFGMFLKENAITVYNDSIAEYLNYLIAEEENKPYKSEAEESLIKSLKDTLRHYEAEMDVLQEVVNKTGNLQESITVGEVMDLERQLYSLELTGKDIQKYAEANRMSHSNAYSYAETPLDIRAVARAKASQKKKTKKFYIF